MDIALQVFEKEILTWFVPIWLVGVNGWGKQ